MTNNAAQVEFLKNESLIFMSIMGPGIAAMRAALMTVYCHPDMNSDDGKMTLAEYILNNNVSKTKQKNIFQWNLKDIDNIKLDDETMDIPLLYKVMENLNPDMWDRLSNKSKAFINDLREKRNKLAHKDFYKSVAASDYLESLKKLYDNILISVESDLPGFTFISNARIEIKSLLLGINEDSVDIDEYLRKRQQFFDNLQDMFISDSRDELAAEKMFGNFTDPFSKLVEQKCCTFSGVHPVVKIFTSPLIKSEETQSIIDYKELLSIPDEKSKQPRGVIVAGLGGSGKTTLCHKIFSEWQNKTSTVAQLQEFDLVLFLEMKHVFTGSILTCLQDNLIVDTVKNLGLEYIIAILNKLKILFLVDGYDERQSCGEQLLKDLVHMLPKARILVTTRRGNVFVKEIRAIFYQVSCVTVNLEGFGDDEQQQFAKQVIELTENKTESAKLCRDFVVFLDSRGQVLRAHLKLPLTLALLILLFLKKRDGSGQIEAINTATQLYLQLMKMMKEKLLMTREYFVPVAKETVDFLLHQLKCRALSQLSDDKSTLQLTEESVTSMKFHVNEKLTDDENSSKYIEFMSAFLTCQEVAFSNNSKEILFAFFHRTQMDYFSAVFIAEELKKDSVKLETFLTHSEKYRYREVLPFISGCLSVIGHLNLNNIKALLKMADTVGVVLHEYNFWFNLISETDTRETNAHDVAYSQPLCDEIGDKISKQNWNLKPEDLIAGFNLLLHCPNVTVTSLEIDCRINDDLKEMTDLITVLQDVKTDRINRKKPVIELHLHIHLHQQKSVEDRSEPYLHCFDRWTKLVKFSGFIGKDAVTKLKFCTQIFVKIENVETFNELMVQAVRNKALKKLEIRINFADFKKSNVKMLPKQSKAEFEIVYSNVTSESLDRDVFTLVKKSTSNGTSYNKIIIDNSSLDLSDAFRLLSVLNDKVHKVVSVRSSKMGLSDEVVSQLGQELRRMNIGFHFLWNNERIPRLP